MNRSHAHQRRIVVMSSARGASAGPSVAARWARHRTTAAGPAPRPCAARTRLRASRLSAPARSTTHSGSSISSSLVGTLSSVSPASGRSRTAWLYAPARPGRRRPSARPGSGPGSSAADRSRGGTTSRRADRPGRSDQPVRRSRPRARAITQIAQPLLRHPARGARARFQRRYQGETPETGRKPMGMSAGAGW